MIIGLRVEVAREYRPSSNRSRIKPENFVLKPIAHRISSSIGREFATEKLQAAACIGKNTVTSLYEQKVAHFSIEAVDVFGELLACFEN